MQILANGEQLTGSFWWPVFSPVQHMSNSDNNHTWEGMNLTTMSAEYTSVIR